MEQNRRSIGTRAREGPAVRRWQKAFARRGLGGRFPSSPPARQASWPAFWLGDLALRRRAARALWARSLQSVRTSWHAAARAFGELAQGLSAWSGATCCWTCGFSSTRGARPDRSPVRLRSPDPWGGRPGEGGPRPVCRTLDAAAPLRRPDSPGQWRAWEQPRHAASTAASGTYGA